MELHWREPPGCKHWLNPIVSVFFSSIISQPENKSYQQQGGASFSDKISRITHTQHGHNFSVRSAWLGLKPREGEMHQFRWKGASGAQLALTLILGDLLWVLDKAM